MQLGHLIKKAVSFLEEAPGNYINKEDAIRPELAGMRIYDEPIFGVAAADDSLFLKLKEPGVVGAKMLLPQDWTDDAKSVLSVFVPFTDRVKRANARSMQKTSDEWLHARIEGQRLLEELSSYICKLLQDDGFAAVCPATDPHFRKTSRCSSNWSERHIAYVCGLGTFGLSRGLITRKGMAGRFSSIVTSAKLQVTPRQYSSPFEYCIMCGKCQRNCPVKAIDTKRGIIEGKDQKLCAGFVDESERPPHGPHKIVRYGCGKCQVDVPCESCIPLSGGAK